MTPILQDRNRLHLILTVFFILGVGASLYSIYTLPASLLLPYGYQQEFIPVYIVLGTTFALGAFTITQTLRDRKEILVFRDRAIDTAEAEREAAQQAGKTTISLETVKSQLQQASGEKNILQAGLQAICKQLEAGQGAVYRVREEDGKRLVELQAGYALSIGESTTIRFEFGEGLIGQAAATGETLYIDDVPEGYINIISGLGSACPRYLLIVAFKKESQVLGVLEVASFTRITEDEKRFVEESAHLIAERL
jgi:hypothetical protein